jgi:hypothetical protein
VRKKTLLVDSAGEVFARVLGKRLSQSWTLACGRQTKPFFLATPKRCRLYMERTRAADQQRSTRLDRLRNEVLTATHKGLV